MFTCSFDLIRSVKSYSRENVFVTVRTETNHFRVDYIVFYLRIWNYHWFSSISISCKNPSICVLHYVPRLYSLSRLGGRYVSSSSTHEFLFDIVLSITLLCTPRTAYTAVNSSLNAAVPANHIIIV